MKQLRSDVHMVHVTDLFNNLLYVIPEIIEKNREDVFYLPEVQEIVAKHNNLIVIVYTELSDNHHLEYHITTTTRLQRKLVA